MFFWLADLSASIPGFNVFRYITTRTGGAMGTAALFVFLFGPWIIDHLRLRLFAERVMPEFRRA